MAAQAHINEWCNQKLSRKFYLICKKCEDDSEVQIIQQFEDIGSKSENKFDSININYTPKRTDHFPLKFIFKYNKPKALKFIMDNFVEHPYESIHWLKIDNPLLKNNLLHYLICDLSSKKEVENAIEIANLLFYNKETYKEELMSCFELLYLPNDYNWTPAQYANQRKFSQLGIILENAQFRHIYQIICIECQIPDVIALEIIQFSFEMFHIHQIIDEIKKKNVNMNHSKIKPTIFDQDGKLKIRKYYVGEIFFRYDGIEEQFDKMAQPSRKELYLNAEEFQRIFGMTKDRFSTLQDWKQVQLKKKYGLF
eukprot:64380_1